MTYLFNSKDMYLLVSMNEEEAVSTPPKPATAPVQPRGRPKKKRAEGTEVPQQKLLDKLKEAVINGQPGQPNVYASTTKGGMKLIYEGHHFRYSFRKGQYSIFQCCYKENKEECKVRVVSDQKRVYPLDGEHVHFMQATDKSVTSVSFEAGTLLAEPEPDKNDNSTDKGFGTSELLDDGEILQAKQELPDDQPASFHISEVTVDSHGDSSGRGTVDEQSAEIRHISEEPPAAVEADANDFREKIKKRLQKALLGKKK